MAFSCSDILVKELNRALKAADGDAVDRACKSLKRIRGKYAQACDTNAMARCTSTARLEALLFGSSCPYTITALLGTQYATIGLKALVALLTPTDFEDVFLDSEDDMTGRKISILLRNTDLIPALMKHLHGDNEQNILLSLTCLRMLCEQGTYQDVKSILHGHGDPLGALVQLYASREGQDASWAGLPMVVATLHALVESTFAPMMVRHGVVDRIPRWLARAPPALVTPLLALFLATVTDDDVRAGVNHHPTIPAALGTSYATLKELDAFLVQLRGDPALARSRLPAHAVHTLLEHILVEAEEEEKEQRRQPAITALPTRAASNPFSSVKYEKPTGTSKIMEALPSVFTFADERESPWWASGLVALMVALLLL